MEGAVFGGRPFLELGRCCGENWRSCDTEFAEYHDWNIVPRNLQKSGFLPVCEPVFCKFLERMAPVKHVRFRTRQRKRQNKTNRSSPRFPFSFIIRHRSSSALHNHDPEDTTPSGVVVHRRLAYLPKRTRAYFHGARARSVFHPRAFIAQASMDSRQIRQPPLTPRFLQGALFRSIHPRPALAFARHSH